jgi:hypothetical protein
MAKAKTTEASPFAAVTVSAMLNAGENATTVTISGAGEGGHRASLLAITPTKRTQTVGEVSWDGDTHTFELPYVADEVRIMDWISMGEYEPILTAAVEPYSENPPARSAK